MENKPLEILIKYHGDAKPLEILPNGDWIDLRAAEDVEMSAFDFKLIPLGVSMELPEGYEAKIAPRSSTYKKWGILQVNSPGVIDNSYSGDDDIWKFPALALRDTKIYAGDRICQFRIVEKQPPVKFREVAHLLGPNRGGFGSTGHK